MLCVVEGYTFDFVVSVHDIQIHYHINKPTSLSFPTDRGLPVSRRSQTIHRLLADWWGVGTRVARRRRRPDGGAQSCVYIFGFACVFGDMVGGVLCG